MELKQKRPPVSVNLSDDQQHTIKVFSTRHGVSRSKFLGRLVDAYRQDSIVQESVDRWVRRQGEEAL